MLINIDSTTCQSLAIVAATVFLHVVQVQLGFRFLLLVRTIVFLRLDLNNSIDRSVFCEEDSNKNHLKALSHADQTVDDIFENSFSWNSSFEGFFFFGGILKHSFKKIYKKMKQKFKIA